MEFTTTTKTQKSNLPNRASSSAVKSTQQTPTHKLLQMQQTIGNRAVSRLIQTKLKVGKPGDVYEREADQVADRVMQMPNPQGKTGLTDTPAIQPLSIQRMSSEVVQAQSDLESQLNNSKGQGSPLSHEVRSFMEPRFGADFSQVRVHTGSEAVQMNRELHAQAFTHQQDIYFGAGKALGNDALTAHELTHVVQQRSTNMLLGKRESVKSPTKTLHRSYLTIQTQRDCSQEQIECFRRCWNSEPPWPIDRGKRGHYLYCQSKCLAEYLECEGQQAFEYAFSSMVDGIEWLANHPEVVIGTIVLVAGVTFIVASGGSGLVLVPALL